ncbi:sulfotransferase domain-containing protein [Lunatimonas salinarum]|uniref:sulfotransferase domain-containing protein n=1 Tax=Lunatimonas salinarum TaxID=1774590 RepID=UPI001AE03949|nr:sulfotransferase domain-containing protein [Lunatimonas salinarum]
MKLANALLGSRNIFTCIPRKFRYEWEKIAYLHPFVRKNQHREITPTNTCCLFAVTRSGSTWLADLLHQVDKSVLLNEPLITVPDPIDLSKPIEPRFVRTDEIKKLGFHYLQPIPHSAEWPEAKDFFERLLSGRIPSRLLYDLDSGNRILTSNYIIAHFNHANLLAGWLQRQFHFKSIVLLRNPCAVVASQLHYPAISESISTKQTAIAHFKFNELFKTEQDLINQLETKEQHLAFLWALQVREILHRNPEISRMRVVYYEHLVIDFEQQIKGIFQWIGQEVPETVWKLRTVPSKSVLNPNSTQPYDVSHLEKWKHQLTPSQIQQILDVVREMGINLYSEDILPEVSG